jgi:hypothetical protein
MTKESFAVVACFFLSCAIMPGEGKMHAGNKTSHTTRSEKAFRPIMKEVSNKKIRSVADSLLIEQLNSIPDDTSSYALIFLGFHDTNHHDINMWIGYDSTRSGEKVYRSYRVMERSASKDDTLFCFNDTIYSDTLIRHIRSIFEKLPVSEEDTSFKQAPVSQMHRDTCYGRGFLFLMTSLLGGKTRDYQNCCSDCTI